VRAQEDLLEAALGEALGSRDLEAVAAIDKLLARLSKRLEMLLREHRLETSQQRPAVVVGIAFSSCQIRADAARGRRRCAERARLAVVGRPHLPRQ
jgi:hypothetical protein